MLGIVYFGLGMLRNSILKRLPVSLTFCFVDRSTVVQLLLLVQRWLLRAASCCFLFCLSSFIKKKKKKTLEWKQYKMNRTTILLYYCKVGSKDVLTSLHGTLMYLKTSILHQTSFCSCSGHPTACSCPYYLKKSCQQKDQGKSSDQLRVKKNGNLIT